VTYENKSQTSENKIFIYIYIFKCGSGYEDKS